MGKIPYSVYDTKLESIEEELKIGFEEEEIEEPPKEEEQHEDITLRHKNIHHDQVRKNKFVILNQTKKQIEKLLGLNIEKNQNIEHLDPMSETIVTQVKNYDSYQESLNIVLDKFTPVIKSRIISMIETFEKY